MCTLMQVLPLVKIETPKTGEKIRQAIATKNKAGI